jgi:hypothetical protein
MPHGWNGWPTRRAPAFETEDGRREAFDFDVEDVLDLVRYLILLSLGLDVDYRKMRSGTHAVANWTEQDLEEISKTRDFEFRVSYSVTLNIIYEFKYDPGDDNTIELFIAVETLLVLEGLDWK